MPPKPFRLAQHQQRRPRVDSPQASVVISIPGSQTRWQVRTCGTRFTVARHSKQIPMPHSWPRPSPRTERRKHCTPARAMAAATKVPEGTVTSWPLTRTVTSGMRHLELGARRQIGLQRNRWRAIEQLISNQAAGCQRGCNAESFVAGREMNSALGGRPDQRQLVRSGRAKTRPAANCVEATNGGHIGARTFEHSANYL